MSKYILLYFLVTVVFSSASAQEASFSPEEKEVIDVIKALFEGMREGDSSAVRQVFYPNARMQSAYLDRQSGDPKLSTSETIDRFVTQVGTPHEAVYDERISGYEIKIDGLLASVWTPYQFYLGEQFSHCGVNAFHLFKSEEGWKITHITDTRRREDCE